MHYLLTRFLRDKDLLKSKDPQAPPSPDYVSGPEYPEYLAPADDEIVVEDQAYADYASPVALSPGYVADSDPEEDSEYGPVDYPADGSDDDDDDDSSDDDEDKEEASEKDEHLAPIDSIVAPAVDPVPSSKETEPFETDESATTPPPPPADHTTPLGARISIRPQAPMPFPVEAKVERLLALPIPSSPLISLSPPFTKEHLARCLTAPVLPSSPYTEEADAIKYCPKGKIKKLEIELWYSKVKGADVASYTLCFQELALMRGRMFPEESDKVERYVGGLPNMIQRNVMSYQPKTTKKAIEFANDQMDKKVLTIAERQAEHKRKLKFNAWNNQRHQQQNKRQNIGRAYTAGPAKKKEYTGSLPLCTKVNYHHKGPCAPRCNKCKKIGHLARDCRSSGPNGRNGNALAKVYVVGNAGTNPDSNVVTGTFLLNNHHASILFDIGANRSFVSTTFSSLIYITPTTLDHYYDVELADGKIIRINTIIRGCTLKFLNHPFNINLMPIELGIFDILISMDWLAKYHAVIVCAKKIVCIPWGNETLTVHGDGSNRGNETRLNIISCTKTQKYMPKGCHVFLPHVTTKETEDKLGEKRLEDVPIV
nr:hypothetical protein [Tanacetum cinerariifolium]